MKIIHQYSLLCMYSVDIEEIFSTKANFLIAIIFSCKSSCGRSDQLQKSSIYSSIDIFFERGIKAKLAVKCWYTQIRARNICQFQLLFRFCVTLLPEPERNL